LCHIYNVDAQLTTDDIPEEDRSFRCVTKGPSGGQEDLAHSLEFPLDFFVRWEDEINTGRTKLSIPGGQIFEEEGYILIPPGANIIIEKELMIENSLHLS
jgi:hypothetical protein